MTSPPGQQPDTIWVRSDTMPDGSYAVSLEYGPDLAWTLTEGAARRHALACFRAAHTAEHDAAVVALLTKIGCGPAEVGAALRDLRGRRSPVRDWPAQVTPHRSGDITTFSKRAPILSWDPRVTAEGKPFLITIINGAEVGQSSPRDVRDHAAGVLSAIEAVRLDTNVREFLQREFALDEARARAFVHGLQEHWPPDPWPSDIAVRTDTAIHAVALAIDESISEFVEIRGSDHGFEADPREAARIAVEALLAAGWRPPLDGADQ